ncbi:hypothetical protein TrST_g2619 [Triparma strigata]|uniref:Phosphatidate cytidylyltransferase n=1 Tax=Triparma strigata TaxID=1606541 RepID=A0A9W7E9H1_9STRA|nr:hypothetical protein TrST_g2619 [Triparma strigata]
MSNTRQRITTAAILIPIVFYLLSTPLSPLLLALLCYINLREMYALDPWKLVPHPDPPPHTLPTSSAVAAVLGATIPYLMSVSTSHSVLLPSLVAAVLFALHRYPSPYTPPHSQANVLFAFLCDVQVLLGYYSMNVIMLTPKFGVRTGVFLCLNCWGVDTAGLIVGKLFKKNSLNNALSSTPPFSLLFTSLKKISPNKTPLGFVACVLSGPLCTLICRCIPYSSPYSESPVALDELNVGLGLAVSCVIGDLIQSWQKRMVNAKDTGTVIRGHGGVWDRMDSMIMAATFLIFAK